MIVKIWALEAFGGTLVFSGGFYGLFEILGVVGGSWRKRIFWGIWSG
jgi:hypothetical protein